MRLEFIYDKENHETIKNFVRGQGVSKALLARAKFQGGKILVNGLEQNVLYLLKKGDNLTLIFPKEIAKETVQKDPTPLDIIYEDEHLLVVNKPWGTPSIPVRMYPTGTMVNRVASYFSCQHYEDEVVHTITRLDKDTSGLMLFAKNSYTHAQMDRALREKKVIKKYQAIVTDSLHQLKEHDVIEAPIGRKEDSTMERMVTDNGKWAKTEYWLKARCGNQALVDILLHTGRTHQIRVHFSHLNCPLVGDTLYGGQDKMMSRQALHCYHLSFEHPLTKEVLTFEIPLPMDMAQLVNRQDV